MSFPSNPGFQTQSWNFHHPAAPSSTPETAEHKLRGNETPEELLDLLSSMPQGSETAERRLQIAQMIAEKGSAENAKELMRQFNLIGVEEATPEQRLELVEALVAHGADLTTMVTDYIAAIASVGFDLKDAPKERLFQVCLTVAETSYNRIMLFYALPSYDFSQEQRCVLFQAALKEPGVPKPLLNKLPQLELSIAQQEGIMTQLAQESAETARALLDRLYCFKLRQMPASTRLDILRTVLDKWPENRHTALSHIQQFGLHEASIEDCRNLTMDILSYNEYASMQLAEHPELLNIHLMGIEDRLRIFKGLCNWGVGQVANTPFMEMFFQDIRQLPEAQQRTECIQRMIHEAPEIAAPICEAVSTFDLEEASLESRLDLAAAVVDVLELELALFYMDSVGIVRHITSAESSQERRERCQQILTRSEIAGSYVADKIAEIPLEEADCLAVIDSLIENCDISPQIIAEHFLDLKLPPSRLLNLALELASTSARVANSVIRQAETFLRLGFQAAELYELYLTCLQYEGSEAPRSFLAYLSMLQVAELPVEQRLMLARLAFRKLPSFDHSDIPKLLDLIQGTSPRDRFQIYKMLIKGHPKGFECLLAFQQASVFDDLTATDVTELFIYHLQCHPANGYPVHHACRLIKGAELGKEQQGRLLMEFAVRGEIPDDPYDMIELFDLTADSQLADHARLLLCAKPDIEPRLKLELRRAGYADFTDTDSIDVAELMQRTLPQDVVNEILGSGDPQVRETLTRWGVYTAASLECMDDERRDLLCQSGVLQAILKHRNPEQRYHLIKAAAQLRVEQLQLLCEEKCKRAKLPWILLASLCRQGFDHSWALACLEQIRGLRMFRDSTRTKELLSFLQNLLSKTPLDPAHTQAAEAGLLRLLTKAPETCARDHAHALSSGIATLGNIGTLLGEEEMFRCMASGQPPKDYFAAHLSTLFGLEDFPSLLERFDATFGAFRNKTALFSYLSSLQRLPRSQRSAAMKAFQIYVRSVLTNSFHEMRYDPEESPQLKTLFSHDPSLERRWRKAALPQALSTAGNSEVAAPDYREIFRTKILVDKHLQPQAEYPRLISYLHNGEVIPAPEGDDPKELFQTLLIELCSEEISLEAFGQRYGELRLDVGELDNDIQALFATESSDALIISESDRADDLLLLGTEILGSCQRVNGTPNLNKCLLGYLLNGEIRAITVKRKGSIVARAVLRLMWDPKAEQPVIFRERVYNNLHLGGQIPAAIDRWAIAKAARMGLALTTVSRQGKTQGATEYNGTLHFYGGRSPFIYSDAAATGIQTGPFTLNKVQCLYHPQQCEAASSQ